MKELLKIAKLKRSTYYEIINRRQKDKYQEIEFNRLDNNELVINLDFSNNGICNDWWCFSYNLIKMDYKLNINNKIIEKKNIFILPQNNEGNNEIKYFEKDRVETFKLKKSPFCVRNFPDYISTTMEVQNGINEFTLMNKTKYDFKEILDEINSFIDAKTRVRVEVRNRMMKHFLLLHYEKEKRIENRRATLKEGRGEVLKKVHPGHVLDVIDFAKK